MSSYYKRTAVCFVLILLLMALCGARVFVIASDGQLKLAATNQSTRRVSVGISRGTIYDCNKVPLTEVNKSGVTVVLPSEQGALALPTFYSGDELDNALQKLNGGSPIVIDKNLGLELRGTAEIDVPKRYSGSLCHIIGYVDSSGHGVSGIEKGMDEYLYSPTDYSVLYSTDSLGRMIAGAGYSVDSGNVTGSVTLTIDSRIQAIAEQAMSDIEAGAAVVLDAKNGKLRAVVSRPDFDPYNVAVSLNSETSPLINRALCPYNVGSVFKPCLSAAALESNQGNYTHNCTGSLTTSGLTFRCNRLAGHGELSLKGATAVSCNTYFYTLGLQLGADIVHSTAKLFRLGQPLSLGGGIVSAAGTLPDKEILNQQPAALINLSIGQGDLLLSPVALSTLYAAIVNDGEYYLPSIIEGFEKNGVYESYPASLPTKAIEKSTANTIKEHLIATLQSGTGSAAYLEGITAGGKTGTAQTGWKDGDRSILNGWFCGFYEGKNTDYVIVVLKEDVKSGSADCAPVFKEITTKLSNLGE